MAQLHQHSMVRRAVSVPASGRDLVLDSAHRLLSARLADPDDNRSWVTSAEIAADLGEARVDVVQILMQLGDDGALTVRSTHVGLDMEVTQVRVTDSTGAQSNADE
jgi:hypothetical protein